MSRREFYKLQASGNDFILIDSSQSQAWLPASKVARVREYKKMARKYCQRKLDIGADGLLVIESSKKAEFKMRIFNPDGSEPAMCGNGARCSALWFSLRNKTDKNIRFETKAGIIESEVKGSRVRIKLSNPKGLELDLPLWVLGRKIKANFIDTGVPHVVIFVSGLKEIDIDRIAKAVRYHKKFQPAGTNVDFVEISRDDFIKVRTYERGVEAETLACGTGAAASAIVTNYKLQITNYKNCMKVLTKSKEALKVHFDRKGKRINNVWLEGKAQCIYKGELFS